MYNKPNLHVNQAISKFNKESVVVFMETSLIPIYGISLEQQKKLANICQITTASDLVTKGRTPQQREDLAKELEIDRKSIDLWVKQADLLRVEGMTSEYAYFLTHAGIRNVEDLAKINVNVTQNALQAAVNIHPVLEYEVEEVKFDDLDPPPVMPLISLVDHKTIASVKYNIFSIKNTKRNQDYILTSSLDIPQNWDEILTPNEEGIILFKVIPGSQQKNSHVFTRFKDSDDKLINYFSVNHYRDYKGIINSFRLRIGEVQSVRYYAQSGENITVSANNDALEFYEDALCTKKFTSQKLDNSDYIYIYFKAVKTNQCDQFYLCVDDKKINTWIYQVVEQRAEYLTVTYNESAPAITIDDLKMLKNNAVKLHPSALVMNNLGLIYPDMPQEIIEVLKEKVSDSEIDVSDECEPTYLFEYDMILDILDRKSESDIINEGLESLREINIALPHPDRFCCKVSYRSIDEKEPHPATEVSGIKVEVTGINDGSDKNEPLTAYTDGEGKFIISLPPGYSMEEEITFTFSDGGYKQSFNINSWDITRDSVIRNYDSITLSAKEILDKLEQIAQKNNELSQYQYERKLVDIILDINKSLNSINSQIKEIETQLEDKNKTEAEKASLNAKLTYYTAEYGRKSSLALQIQQRIDTTETDINKIKTSINSKKTRLESERKKLITDIFGFDPTRNEEERKVSGLVSFIKMGWNYGLGDDEYGFVIIEEVYKNYKDNYSRALPSVKLMGEGDDAVWLPTDRAPSRSFTYSLLQRLVEPTLYPPAEEKGENVNGDGTALEQKSSDRTKLKHPLDINEFKTKISTKTDEYPKMSSLGMGYSLNLRQSWVPDGFALGELLYSLILAPGEEQRLVVREKNQSYTIFDQSTGEDYTASSQSQTQSDDLQALYNYVANQYMDAGSEYEYHSDSNAFGGSGAFGLSGITSAVLGFITGGLTGSFSKSNGNASSHSYQNNNHNEASQAAQNFNQKFSAASNMLQQAKRVSIRSATSNESDSVATKIIANHNHSHAMTVQYWEIVRRYRLKTTIDGIDLLLFVPLNPICFLPVTNTETGDKVDYDLDLVNLYMPEQKENDPPFEDLSERELFRKRKEVFNKRYETVMLHYSTIRSVIPYKYRAGLDLIQKFYTLPFFRMDSVDYGEKPNEITITVAGKFCEFDRISATIYFNNGNMPVTGKITKMLSNSLKFTDGENKTKFPHNSMEVLQSISEVREHGMIRPAEFKFVLPYGCTEDNISKLVIKNNIPNQWRYTLSQNEDYLTQSEKDAISRYRHWMHNKYGDIESPDKDQKHIDMFSEGLPEWYFNPVAKFSSGELWATGMLEIEVSKNSLSGYETLASEIILDAGGYIYSFDNSCPRMSISDVQKMEETFHHIVTENLRYSKVIWQSLTTDELAMMLEQYTVDMDFDNYYDIPKSTDGEGDTEENEIVTQIPLLNCINVKKPMGFYGNCILFPFTYPQRFADKIGKTAAEIQDELYRYHSSYFRSPSTVISVPTEGMIGEAVLGATNVSEKIDITRFWNWKDSPIDSMELTKDYLNTNDYLKDKNTKDITALNLSTAERISPTDVENIIKMLTEKQSPEFQNLTGLDQTSTLLGKAIESTGSGRDNALEQSSSLTGKAMEHLAKMTEIQTERIKMENEKEKFGTLIGKLGNDTTLTANDIAMLMNGSSGKTGSTNTPTKPKDPATNNSTPGGNGDQQSDNGGQQGGNGGQQGDNGGQQGGNGGQQGGNGGQQGGNGGQQGGNGGQQGGNGGQQGGNGGSDMNNTLQAALTVVLLAMAKQMVPEKEEPKDPKKP